MQAFVYKTCMWYLYVAELKPRLTDTRRHRVCVYVSEAFWIEFGLDFVTLMAFAIATAMMFDRLAR